MYRDREFYADLWGIKSRAALSHDAWRRLRKRSALIALFTVAVLTAYLLVTPVFEQAPGPRLANDTAAVHASR